jgi:hypothetical protein
MFRFTIRELAMLTTIVALAAALLVAHLSYRASLYRIRRETSKEINMAYGNAQVLNQAGLFISNNRVYREHPTTGELILLEPASEPGESTP